MSDSWRTFAIDAYIGGCITRSKRIMTVPQYDTNENEIGIEEIIALSILPLDRKRRAPPDPVRHPWHGDSIPQTPDREKSETSHD